MFSKKSSQVSLPFCPSLWSFFPTLKPSVFESTRRSDPLSVARASVSPCVAAAVTTPRELLTAPRIAAVEARGGSVATRDPLRSMALSRGAAALGVALALGEVAPEAVEGAIGADAGPWCSRAGCSAGSELLGHEIVVFGMSDTWRGLLAVEHAVMADALDVAPVSAAMTRLGLEGTPQLDEAARSRLVALLAKAEAAHGGTVRGSRHVMLDDSDIAATRHARAFVGGVLAGHTELFVSGGAEHQGPDGGGPVAIIARRADPRRAS